MNKDFNKIFTQSSTPVTEAMIKGYIDGTLSVEEKHFVERQMAEDEFLNDAIEGLLIAKQQGFNTADLEKIKTSYPIKNGRVLKINTKYFYYAAATFLLLIGIGSLYFYFLEKDNKKSSMAVNQVAESNVISVIPDSNQIQRVSSTNELISKDTQDKLKASSYNDKNKIEKVIDQDNVKTEVVNNRENNTTESNNISSEDQTTSGVSFSNEKSLNDDVNFSSSSTVTQSNAPSIQSTTIDESASNSDIYRNETDAISSGSIKMEKKSVVSSSTIKYLEAKRLFDKKEYEDALKTYRNIIKSDDHYEDAQWEMTICFEKLKDFTSLKVQLNKIISEKGKYASKAEKKLKSIN